MKKVLICMTSLSIGNGIAKVIMNYYDCLIKQGYSVDFLLILNLEPKKEYIEQITKANSKIFVVPKGNKLEKCLNLIKELPQILKNNQYDIVHVNLVRMYALCCIWISKVMKVKNIIFHIHNPIPETKKIKQTIIKFFNFLCIKGSNHYFACSVSAGKSIFDKRNFYVVRNLIQTTQYAFDENARNRYRSEWNIKDNDFLIGNIARFENQKNPFFIIDIISELMQSEKDVKFLWIGEGNLKNKIKDYIKEKRIDNKCIILGNRDDVNKIYSSLDLFFLPSKYEGLGIVFIEAQCAGVPVLTSNKVPLQDLRITDLFQHLELEKNEKAWKEKIIDIKRKKYRYKREQYCDIIRKTKYDISNNYIMVELYNKILNGEKL